MFFRNALSEIRIAQKIVELLQDDSLVQPDGESQTWQHLERRLLNDEL